MNIFVVYDSFFGNTEAVAQRIGEALKDKGSVTLSRVQDADPVALNEADIVVAGSPTRAFQPTKDTKALLKELKKGTRIAFFDTRVDIEKTDHRLLKFLEKRFGYANDTFRKLAAKRRWELLSEPEGFFVADSEGPLEEGELDRARAWAEKLI